MVCFGLMNKRKHENMVLPVCLLRACVCARQQCDNNLKYENMILSVRACLPVRLSCLPSFVPAFQYHLHQRLPDCKNYSHRDMPREL